ncbi:MAG: hypothetical protein Kow0079_12880 [Vicingaceae bacterium]
MKDLKYVKKVIKQTSFNDNETIYRMYLQLPYMFANDSDKLLAFFQKENPFLLKDTNGNYMDYTKNGGLKQCFKDFKIILEKNETYRKDGAKEFFRKHCFGYDCDEYIENFDFIIELLEASYADFVIGTNF